MYGTTLMWLTPDTEVIKSHRRWGSAARTSALTSSCVHFAGRLSAAWPLRDALRSPADRRHLLPGGASAATGDLARRTFPTDVAR